jgi:cytochrome c biogenesis protein CcmG/thiol:disulfide interchange protein DsbE
MKRFRFLIPLLGFALLTWMLWRGLDPNRDPKALPSPLIGQAAPTLQLPTLAHPEKTWANTAMRGQIWVLNVFASWCRPCLDEHPVLTQFGRDTQIPIVGLNYKDNPDQVTAWLAKHGNPYQEVVTDTDGRAGMDYGVYGVPETFVIDRHGIIRFKFSGPLTPDIVRQVLMPQIQALQP